MDIEHNIKKQLPQSSLRGKIPNLDNAVLEASKMTREQWMCYRFIYCLDDHCKNEVFHIIFNCACIVALEIFRTIPICLLGEMSMLILEETRNPTLYQTPEKRSIRIGIDRTTWGSYRDLHEQTHRAFNEIACDGNQSMRKS